MPFIHREFDNPIELADYLNGIPLSNPFVVNARVKGLHNLTLIINDGVADRTTTFADASGEGLLPKEIMDQIHATHANMANVVLKNYAHSVPAEVRITVIAAGYVIDKDGTANTILGFATLADTTVGTDAVASGDVLTIFHLENQRIGVIHQ
jgi:hypothetical protein